MYRRKPSSLSRVSRTRQVRTRFEYITRNGAENVLDRFLVIALVISMLHSAVFHPLITIALLAFANAPRY